jgi:hypothetical protein
LSAFQEVIVVGQELEGVGVAGGNLASSRKPDDLPAFCRDIVSRFAS